MKSNKMAFEQMICPFFSVVTYEAVLVFFLRLQEFKQTLMLFHHIPVLSILLSKIEAVVTLYSKLSVSI